jgi:hypothetical protein
VVVTAAFSVDGTKASSPGKKDTGDTGKTTAGIWFGPRMGKRSKSNVDIPWTVLMVRGKFVSSPRKIPPWIFYICSNLGIPLPNLSHKHFNHIFFNL